MSYNIVFSGAVSIPKTAVDLRLLYANNAPFEKSKAVYFVTAVVTARQICPVSCAKSQGQLCLGTMWLSQFPTDRLSLLFHSSARSDQIPMCCRCGFPGPDVTTSPMQHCRAKSRQLPQMSESLKAFSIAPVFFFVALPATWGQQCSVVMQDCNWR